MPQNFLKTDPISLLKLIVELGEINSGDPRAQLRFVGLSGTQFNGVPMAFMEGELGPCVVVKQPDTERITYLRISSLSGIEIENAASLKSFLAKPWAQNPKYVSMTKLQASRELEAFGKEFQNTQFQWQFETLPNREDAIADSMTWTEALKTTLENMGHDATAKEAIDQIRLFEMKFEKGGIKSQKNGTTVMFQVDLTRDCFNTRKIEELLNSVL